MRRGLRQVRPLARHHQRALIPVDGVSATDSSRRHPDHGDVVALGTPIGYGG